MAHKNKPTAKQRRAYQPPLMSKYTSLQEITLCSCVDPAPDLCDCPKMLPGTYPTYGTPNPGFGQKCACQFKDQGDPGT